MKTFELSLHKRARIWFGRPEPHVLQPCVDRTFRVSPAARVAGHREAVVVEVLTHLGPRLDYALLGARTLEVAAELADSARLEVLVNSSAGPDFESSLAGIADTVHWGLPSEYADAVCDAARAAIVTGGVPAGGGVRFEWAAHGEASSSPETFARLTRIVMRLLVAPKDADLRAIVDDG